MESSFHTLHEFMLFTESVTYIIIVAALLGILAFWRFLSGSDRKKDLGMDEGEE